MINLILYQLVKLQSSINFFQFNYYSKISKKLSDQPTSPKCYWTLLRTLLNGRKIPGIPPLFHNNKFITDFKEITEIFNSFFAKQCSLIDNGSTLPWLFPVTTEKSLSDVDFSVLHSNKAHGDKMISIRMLKLCDQSICNSLSVIFKSCLTNCRPVSFPSICSKVLEHIIYNTMFTCFIENNLISENQSRFKPGNSCFSQLLAITHEYIFELWYQLRS